MKRTFALAIGGIIGLLLTGACAMGQLADSGRLAAAPPTVRSAGPPSDVKSIALMYRKTVDCYRGLAAGYVFQTHVGIGLVAELSANKVYSAEQARAAVERMTGGMAAMQTLLKGLAGMDLPPKDRELVTGILKLVVQVAGEGKMLTQYLESGKQEDANAYHKMRADAAAAIGKFLGIG